MDIKARAQVELLVRSFYTKVRAHPELSHVFDEVAEIDWQTHLPRMDDFWCSVLLHQKGFKGNPLQKHVALSFQTQLSAQLFGSWLKLFRETVDELFEGPGAEAAKARAAAISETMQRHIHAAHQPHSREALLNIQE